MEKYVVSKELCKKLNEAGYPQTTEYGYFMIDGYKNEPYERTGLGPLGLMEDIGHQLIGAAPVSDELLAQLGDQASVRLLRDKALAMYVFNPHTGETINCGGKIVSEEVEAEQITKVTTRAEAAQLALSVLEKEDSLVVGFTLYRNPKTLQPDRVVRTFREPVGGTNV
jgi:hypothetical protein